MLSSSLSLLFLRFLFGKIIIFYYYFAHKHKATCFKHCTKQGMTATASNWNQRCRQRRPHFPFGGLLTTDETEKMEAPVINVPVCRFPGQAQQPSASRYTSGFHGNWIKDVRWPLPGSPLYLPLWQCRQCVILHKCLGQ